MKLRIAARKSDLARLQAYQVGKALKDHKSDLQIEYVFKTSLGDQNQSDPLWKMPEKGVFTEDLKQDLLDGNVDLAVHSWKDLPTEISPDTEIFGTLARADMRDLLLFKKTSVKPKDEYKIMSSSPRRLHHLEKFLPNVLPFENAQLNFVDVRGNINTRLKKLLQGDADALVVAKAALDRLLSSREEEFKAARDICREALRKCEFMVLPITACPPAAAQGALAIEALRTRQDLHELVLRVNVENDFESVQHERKVLANFGGGCQQKIGVAHLFRPWGQFEVVKGETTEGESLDSRKILRTDLPSFSTAKPFPAHRKESVFYSRQDLRPKMDKLSNWEGGLFIARESAWPQDFAPENQHIWCSGIETWQKLAAKGIWVHGTSEALGEREEPQINTLVGKRLKWMKLTHSKAAKTHIQDQFSVYELVTEKVPDLQDKTHFYWMSYWAFQEALKAFPDIEQRHHSCGPGNTFDLLQSHRDKMQSLTVFLSYDDWLDSVRGEN